MAVYKIFPLQDASMYSFYPNMNTGIDPIIEVGNLNVNINPVPQVFRYLVEFDQNEINSVVNTKVGGTQFSSSLRCFIANAQGVNFNTNLNIYPVSGSWHNGTGTYLDSPFTTNGVSWNYRLYEGAGEWDSIGSLKIGTSLSFTGGGNPNDGINTGNITDINGQSTANVTIVANGGNFTSITVNSSDLTWDSGDIITLIASDLVALGFTGNPDLLPLTIDISPNDINYGEPYVSAYYSGSNTGGGNWYTGSSDPYNTNIKAEQSFTLRSQKDLNVPVTDIVKVWYSSSNNIGNYTDIQNNGFIVKWEDALEWNSADAIQPIMQFYSVDTNTIYPPQLEIKWDDQSFETGLLPPIQTTDMYVALDSNPGVFYSESINRFRLNVRPDFPVRTFLTSSLDTKNHYLPNGSLYSVKDLDTNETLIDFDPEFTKISCDNQSNYFDIYMNGLQPERYYKILIQTEVSGSTIVKDDNYYFKVINR
jgi:hypothetical protein|tara:strand:- start:60 stop:1493 length:1434 start_codon:yes stop_codon:yes gene_type:complete